MTRGIPLDVAANQGVEVLFRRPMESPPKTFKAASDAAAVTTGAR